MMSAMALPTWRPLSSLEGSCVRVQVFQMMMMAPDMVQKTELDACRLLTQLALAAYGVACSYVSAAVGTCL